MKNIIKATTIVLSTAALSLQASASFTSIGQVYSESFNGYRGSEATLPANMSVTWDDRISEPFQGVNTGALTAYTSDSLDYSFGIRERNPVDLRDARLFLEITNNTGVAITGFEVSYEVEAWFIGDRRNRIRLKYDTFLDSADAGRDTFEVDIFSTVNPSAEMTPDTDVDGSLAANRILVSGFVDLMTLDDGTDTPFGALAAGETAYFRWQFSNADGDGGSLRSGLAINNLSITAIPEPSTYAALLGLLALALVWYRRRPRG